MGLIDERLEELKNKKLDINEHLETIKKYSVECDSVIEMGVRSIVSTWALLAGRPKKMISIDIKHPSFYGGNLDEVYESCEKEGICFKFELKSSLEYQFDEVDLLFIDTVHTYDFLSTELKLHGNKVKKYIILHDTEIFKNELMPAVNEFLKDNNEWKIKECFINNNGLTVLERIK